MNKKQFLGIIYYIIAVLVVLHHFWICGKWFELEDILHHETIVVVSIAIATLLCFDP